MAPRQRRRKAKREAVHGITSISVCGYKSIAEECQIELRRLTVLAGVNNSGKSSIIQPLLMLKQTLDAPYDPGPLQISGPNVRFTDVNQFFPKIPGVDCPEELSIKIETDRRNSLRLSFSRDKRKGIDIDELSYVVDNDKGVLRRSMTQASIKKNLPSSAKLIEDIIGKQISGGVKWGLSTDRCFIQLGIIPSTGKDRKRFGITLSPASYFQDFIRGIIHVPGHRGNPERFYRTTAIGPVFPGTFNEYVASIIRYWKDENDARLTKLGNALQSLGLTWRVDARTLDATRVEIQVGRLSRSARGRTRDMVSIADVGFGVSQVLPVLVALLTAKRGQLVYIEQPEIHLHPQAQVVMAELLVEAANKGARVLVETHSPLLLLSLQALVAEGTLKPERLKLHWFNRRSQDGVTEIRSADLDETGAFGDWPVDFGNVTLDLEDRYLSLAELRLKSRNNAA